MRATISSAHTLPVSAQAAPAQTTIALLQSSSLVSAVQHEIERRILQGDLQPGDKLIEAALAQDLGVSRGPVREAFRMLEEAGQIGRAHV